MFLRTIIPLLALTVALKAQEDNSTYQPIESIVKVVAVSECSDQFVGSGVAIAPDTIVTTAHGVQGCSQIQVHHRSGRIFAVTHHILAADLDLCLLKVPGLPCRSAILYEGELPPLGSAVTAIGYPGGAGPITTSGQLTAQWKVPHAYLFQSSAAVRPGNSGGGIFTDDGRLLGITSFVLSDAQGFNVSVPATWIPQLLQGTWQEGRCITVCKPKEIITQDFINWMTEDPANHKAWEAFSRAWVAKSPRDSNAWYSLGHTLTQRLYQSTGNAVDGGLAEAARTAYQRAIELNPSHVRAWNNLGTLLITLGQEEKALQALDRAVELKDDYGLAWLNMGAAYLNLGKYKEASQAYAKGLSFLPGESGRWASLAFCESKTGRMDEAIMHMRIALRHQPMRLEWWKELSSFCARAKRQTEFQETFREIQKRLPDFAERIQEAIQGN